MLIGSVYSLVSPSFNMLQIRVHDSFYASTVQRRGDSLKGTGRK